MYKSNNTLHNTNDLTLKFDTEEATINFIHQEIEDVIKAKKKYSLFGLAFRLGELTDQLPKREKLCTMLAIGIRIYKLKASEILTAKQLIYLSKKGDISILDTTVHCANDYFSCLDQNLIKL